MTYENLVSFKRIVNSVCRLFNMIHVFFIKMFPGLIWINGNGVYLNYNKKIQY